MRAKIDSGSAITGNVKARSIADFLFKKNQNIFLASFIRISWIILLLASILQGIIFRELSNIVGVLYVILAWAILTKFFLRIEILRHFPFSTFVAIGFTLTQFYFPLIFTLLEGKALIFNLAVPYEVFLHSTLQLIVITVAHLVYRSYQPNPRNANSILYRAGLFTPPSETQMWLMGAIGLLSMFYIYFYAPSGNEDVSGVGAKFIQGFVPFSYAPFFIPLGRLYGKSGINTKKFIPKLVIFIILLFLISIGRNSRGSFMFGFTGVGFSYGLGLLLGFFNPRLLTFRNLVFAVIGYWVFSGPMADLATAMILLRGTNNDQSRTELILLTWKTYNDKDAIRNYRLNYASQQPATDLSGWNEYYLDDVFLSRFANIKYNDESLLQADKIGKPDEAMRDFSANRLVSYLPAPVLSSFGLDINKQLLGSASFGDYLYFRAGAGANVLGGLRTANLAGTGMASFGWWYLLILGLAMPVIFYLLEKLVIIKTIQREPENTSKQMQLRFSLAGLLIITSIFQFMSVESVVGFGGFIMRDWVQQVLLYCLMFYITNKLSQRIGKSKSRKFIKRQEFQSANVISNS